MAKKKGVIGYLAVSKEEENKLFENRMQTIQETFKGEVVDKEIRFPKKLGAEHPFDFSQAERIYQNIGVINAILDKITDAIVGDFVVVSEDENVQQILDEFIKQSDFKVKLRPWVKEAIGKGNGFMEIDLKERNIRVLNANHMYIKRNKKGEVKRYHQFIPKDLRLFSNGKVEPTPFEKNEIAHLPINKIPSDPYGIGLVWPSRVAIENYAGAEVDAHKLQSRKAGMPIHVKIGQPGQSVQQGDIDDFKAKLQFMNNSTEWVTDGNIEMDLIDFKGVLDNSIKTAEHDLEQIAIGMKIPMAIIGVANNPEGLAKVNDKGFIRFINSVRLQVEEVIENKIFNPLILSNNLKTKLEFQWELQDEEAKDKRMKSLTDALKNPFISPELKAGLEKEIAKLLELDDVVKVLPSPEEAARQEEIRRKEEEELKQPEVPGAKPTANSSGEVNVQEFIRKKGNEWCVFSEKGKNLGCFPSKSQAQKRLKDVEFFKRKNESNSNTMSPNGGECASCKEASPKLTEEQLNSMSIAEYVNITPLEEKGFNYTDYLVKILQNLRTDKFEELRAKTEIDIARGLLPQKDINKLRTIFKDGFRKNKTIRQIENEIKDSIDLRDRTMEKDGEIVVTKKAESRPNAIARTEATRLANQGLKSLYLDNKVERYRYLAALDERTSDICNSLNGQVFLTKDGIPGTNMPPMHTNCRSTIVGVVL